MIYEYECTNCSHKWEKEQSIKDKALKKCPKCKKMTAKRLISGNGAFILLGGRWSTSGYN